MNDTQQDARCPRCHAGRLKSWRDLSEEEQMLARRLPSQGYSQSEREARHRWCVRCGYEDTRHESSNT